MAFSINQVKHLFVAKATKDSVANLTEVGDIFPRVTKDKKVMYFQYKSPGGLITSDDIPLAHLTHAKATGSDELAYKLKRSSIQLDPKVSDTPIQGQNYIVRLSFRQYIGLSEDDQYQKYGECYATKGMTASQLYAELALSLAKNMSPKHETTPLANVYLGGGTEVQVTSRTKIEDLTGEYTSIIFEEVKQDWVLGMMPQAFIPFTPQSLPITVDGGKQLWGKVTTVPSTKVVENGCNIADLEYFFVGARGDIYRNMGFPNVIHTTYLVDPSKKYDTLDLHFYFVGAGVEAQKSEKDLVIVVENDGEHTKMNALITAINTASGLSIALLS